MVRVRREVEKKRELRRAETREDYEATEDQELGRCVWGKVDMVKFIEREFMENLGESMDMVGIPPGKRLQNELENHHV